MAEIVLQANSKLLTFADVIGSTFRDARLSWRTTVTILFLPSLVFSVAYSLENWSIMHQAGASIRLSFLAIAFCILIIARFVIRSKQFAIILYQSKQSPDVSSAIKLANQKKGLVFLSCWPALVLDGTLLIFMHLWMQVIKGLHNAGAEAWSLIATALVVDIPYTTINLLNLIFMAILIKENTSILATCKRFGQLLGNNLGYVVNFLLLYVFISMLLDMTCLFFFSLPAFLQFVPGIGKDNIFVRIFENVLMAIPTGFLNAANAFSCAVLYEQLTMRSEGSDLIEQLAP